MMMFMLQMTQAAITLPLTDPVLKFLLILVIILAAPLLLNKLRIPHLLGFGNSRAFVYHVFGGAGD